MHEADLRLTFEDELGAAGVSLCGTTIIPDSDHLFESAPLSDKWSRELASSTPLPRATILILTLNL